MVLWSSGVIRTCFCSYTYTRCIRFHPSWYDPRRVPNSTRDVLVIPYPRAERWPIWLSGRCYIRLSRGFTNPPTDSLSELSQHRAGGSEFEICEESPLPQRSIHPVQHKRSGRHGENWFCIAKVGLGHRGSNLKFQGAPIGWFGQRALWRSGAPMGQRGVIVRTVL